MPPMLQQQQLFYKVDGTSADKANFTPLTLTAEVPAEIYGKSLIVTAADISIPDLPYTGSNVYEVTDIPVNNPDITDGDSITVSGTLTLDSSQPVSGHYGDLKVSSYSGDTDSYSISPVVGADIMNVADVTILPEDVAVPVTVTPDDVTVPVLASNGTYTYTVTLPVNNPDIAAGDNVTVTGTLKLNDDQPGEHHTGVLTITSYNGDTAGYEFTPAVGGTLNLSHITVNDSPVTVGIPVFRLYDPSTGNHHYTDSGDELAWLDGLGWNPEGIAFMAYEPGDPDAVPVFRAYNPANGEHLWTTDVAEWLWVALNGWNAEGVSWFAAEDGIPAMQ